MPGTLGVWLPGKRIGTITNLPGDDNLFTFVEEMAGDRNAPVLSQSFIGTSGTPIRVVPRTHRVAPPFFANLLPEEDALLRTIIARQHGINRTRDFPFLRALGQDLPGAITIRSDDEHAEDAERPGGIGPAERPLRFSLAGVQLKFSGSMAAHRLTIPLDGIGGSWIVKLPANAFPRLPENEFAMMSLAAAIGLNVPPIELVSLDEIEGLPSELPSLRADEPRIAYAISRFDRLSGGGRVHAEDFNQIADQPPAAKYDGKATHWIANVIATLCPGEDLDEFVRRLVFGICIGNNDMHLKNWAVVYPDGRNARIAPMYDFVCTRAYYPNGGLALTIGGHRPFEQMDHAALRSMAERAEISVKRTQIVADETVSSIREAWPAFKATIPDAQLVTALERHFAMVPLMRER